MGHGNGRSPRRASLLQPDHNTLWLLRADVASEWQSQFEFQLLIVVVRSWQESSTHRATIPFTGGWRPKRIPRWFFPRRHRRQNPELGSIDRSTRSATSTCTASRTGDTLRHLLQLLLRNGREEMASFRCWKQIQRWQTTQVFVGWKLCRSSGPSICSTNRSLPKNHAIPWLVYGHQWEVAPTESNGDRECRQGKRINPYLSWCHR